MGRMYWVRVAMMIFTFGVVVMTMRNLQRTKPTASPIAKLILGSAEEQKFVICPTRITAVQTPDGFGLVEEKMHWFRTSSSGGDSAKTELDPIAVEKWFGRYCSVSGKKTETGADFKPVLELKLVSGGSKVLSRSGSGEYSWEGERFVSGTLDEALQVLPQLPVKAATSDK